MHSNTLEEIAAKIDAAGRVLITSHDRPDGDALGSALGLAGILERRGKRVEVVNNDRVPDTLAFLPGAGGIRRPGEESSEAELLIVLDSSDRNRIGEPVWAFAQGIEIVNIDHHVSNTEFGDWNYVDSVSPATGQIVHELATAAGWSLSGDDAENLFAAISTDTGSFRYPSTTAKTFRIAAELIELGVDVGRINQQLYEKYPRRRVLLMKNLLQDLRFDCDGRCASVMLPLAVSIELGLEPGDSEGVIDVIRAIDSVIVAVLFEELPGGKIRVSSRSKEERYSVREICSRFGGGGHTLAAGARLDGPLAEAAERFREAVCAQLREN